MGKKSIRCVACFSQQVRKINFEGYRILTCSGCQLQWVDGVLRNLEKEKSSAFNLFYISKESIGDIKKYTPYQDFFTYIENRYPNRTLRILDVGCGVGSFVEYALSRGHDCMGVETDSSCEKDFSSRTRQKIKITEIENFTFNESNQFDVVTFWDSFEHLRFPFQVLDHIKTGLTSDGTVYLRVNNRWDIYNIFTDLLRYISLNWHKKVLVQCFASEGTSPHYWNFSIRGMLTILERKGWVSDYYHLTETPATRLTKRKILIFIMNCAYAVNKIILGGKGCAYYISKKMK